jgi:hypothetical protein
VTPPQSRPWNSRYLAPLALERRIEVRHAGFNFNALDASAGDAGELRDFGLRVPRASQNLDFVPLEHVDHPFPRCLMQRVCDPKGLLNYGQIFRKSVRQNLRKTGRQSFRNPQGSLIAC